MLVMNYQMKNEKMGQIIELVHILVIVIVSFTNCYWIA
jgi:hypothetical protein